MADWKVRGTERQGEHENWKRCVKKCHWHSQPLTNTYFLFFIIVPLATSYFTRSLSKTGSSSRAEFTPALNDFRNVYATICHTVFALDHFQAPLTFYCTCLWRFNSLSCKSNRTENSIAGTNFQYLCHCAASFLLSSI
jgi:hypothetical protein